MTLTTRTILILTLLLPLAGEVLAQETTTDKPAAATSTAATSTVEVTSTGETAEEPAAQSADAVTMPTGAYEIRNRFTQLLQRYPYELTQILAIDPSLLTNEQFLAGYPELVRFLEAHPEVRRHPRFYLAEYAPRRQANFFEEALEGIFIFSIFAFIAFVLAWVVRTIVEQKRWSRLTRSQSEVHNKILDRFSSSEELLAYIRTPAGSKFLESAPIPLHSEPVAPSTPATRILWSIQLGTIIAVGALGMILVSFRFEKETAEGMFAMGAIAFAVGAGFIASAVVSLALSRRLGLWPSPDAGAAPSKFLDETGPVR